MKRQGHIYENMFDWDTIVEAERKSTSRKLRNIGVRQHIRNRFANLVDIQHMILDENMMTTEYKHERRVSGQDKVRDIAKLKFHPNHIEHQLLTMALEERLDKTLIRNTFASRIGYGQIRCALKIKKNLRKYVGQERWGAQCDIVKYYKNIDHNILRGELEHLIKDKRYIDAFMEPFERYGETGIPLGIRPSQSAGNLMLSRFDHYMIEKVHASDYIRYLDDFFFTGAKKGEVKRKFKMAKAYLSALKLTLHEPKIHRLSEGFDMMGFVFYGNKGDMWWRKSNKKKWLRHRSRLVNKKRIHELDDAAFGMLKWGNGHCRKLWNNITKREMGVKLKQSRIKETERTDKNGVPYIEAKKISMQMLLDKEVVCLRWFGGVKTSQGEGRYVILVRFMETDYKVIVNAIDIKTLLEDMTRNNVTKFKTVFVDNGMRHYSINYNATEILEVDGREIEERNDAIYFVGTDDKVKFN